MALLAYLDCSGDAQDPATQVVGIAGFIAHETQWTRFELEWAAVLREFGVSALHMREFAHSIKGSEFEGWRGDEPKRSAFVAALTKVINDCTTQSIATTLFMNAYRTCDMEHRLRESLGSPYSITSLVAIAAITDWHKRTGLSEPLTLIFESGDNEQHNFRRVLGSFKGSWNVEFITEPVFRPKTWRNADGSKGYCQPLQAADFISYEATKAATDYIGKHKTKVRESYFAIAYPPRDQKMSIFIPKDMLRKLIADYKVARRFNLSETADESRLPAEPLCYMNMDYPLISIVGRESERPRPQFQRPGRRKKGR